MLTQTRSALPRLFSIAVLGLSCLQPLALRAEPLEQNAQPSASSASSSCAPLLAELRWHQPFFGMRMWWEVAPESLSYASPTCRRAIAGGRAPEVAAALHGLAQHSAEEGMPLKKFIYRIACQLRVPEAQKEIYAGLREPAVYPDCADALFSMSLDADEATRLREVYLAGLRSEPLKTHLPAGILQPSYAANLGPVLRAYDAAQLPQRDAIYRALCAQKSALPVDSRALCEGPSEREPQWAKEKLRRGDIAGGLSHIAALLPEQLPLFADTLLKFDNERRAGRDRLYTLLCKIHPPADAKLGAVCRELSPDVEPEWPLRKKEQRVAAIISSYTSTGRHIGEFMFIISLLTIAHALWSRRQNRLEDQRFRTALDRAA